MKTIQNGIVNARKRGERGLNLPFSAEQITTLSDVFKLKQKKDTYVDLRNAVAKELGFDPWITNGMLLTIDERLSRKHYLADNLQFLIEDVEEMCNEFDIDPEQRQRKDLSEAIYQKILKEKHHRQ